MSVPVTMMSFKTRPRNLSETLPVHLDYGTTGLKQVNRNAMMNYDIPLCTITKLWFKSSFDACTESIVPKSCLLLRPQDGVNLLFVRLQKENLATKFISLGSISITSSIHTASSNIL